MSTAPHRPSVRVSRIPEAAIEIWSTATKQRREMIAAVSRPDNRSFVPSIRCRNGLCGESGEPADADVSVEFELGTGKDVTVYSGRGSNLTLVP